MNQYTSIIKLFIAFCEKHRPGLLYSKTDAETLADNAECTSEVIKIIYRFNMAAIKADNYNIHLDYTCGSNDLSSSQQMV